MKLNQFKSASPQRAFALACAVFLAVGVVLAGLGPALPYLAKQIGREIAVLGWLFTAISAGVVLAQFAAGPASDRFGQRPVLAAGMLLMSAGTGGITFGSSLATMLFGALLAGFGFGCVLAGGNVLVAKLFPARSAAALNGVNLFFGIGSMIGPAVAGLASARLGLPQAALWLGAGLLVALAPVALAGPEPAARTAASASRSAAPERTAALWLIGLLLLVYTGTEVGFGAWVTVYMITSAALAPATAALVAAGFWLALTSGRALGALLGLRLAPQTLLVASLLGMLIGAMLLTIGVGQLQITLAGVLLLGLACGPVFPTTLAVVTGAAHGSGSATSLVLAIGNCGGLAIPALLGLLLNWYGPAAAAGLLLGSALAMVGLCTLIVRTGAVRPSIRQSHGTQP